MPNRLQDETSPYLLQHASNPVNWYPWGIEALQKAKAENKPIFLSIGYSACHWCHIMARESFENKEIISGKTVNAEISVTNKAIIMIKPKSIIGLISDITSDKKATTVVKKV